MELERLFITLALEAQQLMQGLKETTAQSVSWASSFGKQVSTVLANAFMIGIAAVGTALLAIGAQGLALSADIDAAAGDIQASLGSTAQEAERLANIAAQAWGDNFAGSIEEAGEAVVIVRKQLGDLPDDAILRATENAFRLADAFGVEVPASVDAAKALMENFGVSSDEAFDLIARGFQSGLDGSGDFLESVTEFSNQFAEGGAEVEEFFSVMESGLSAGMLGTDKAADLFKEFTLRIGDGSDSTADALDSIGVSMADIEAGFRDGSITAIDAFAMVQDGIRNTDDPLTQFSAGVALMGTQFEDLGQQAALGLSVASDSFEDVQGAAESLDAQYNTLGDAFEGARRKFLLSIEPMTGRLLDLANEIMPDVLASIDGVMAVMVPAFDALATTVERFVANLQDGQGVAEAFTDALEEMVPPAVINAVIALVTAIGTFVIITTVVGWIGSFVTAIGVLTAASAAGATTLTGLATLMGGPVTLAIAAVAIAMGVLAVAWKADWLGMKTATIGAVAAMKPAMDSLNGTNGEVVAAMAETSRQSARSMDDLIEQGRKIKDVQEIWGGFGTLITGTSHEVGEARRDIVHDMALSAEGFEQFADAMEEAFGVERTAQTDAQLQKLFEVTTATRDLQEQAESLAASDRVLIESTQTVTESLIEFTDAQISSAEASDTLLFATVAQAEADQGLVIATDEASNAMMAQHEAALQLIPVFNSSAGMVNEFLEAQEQLSTADGFEIVNGRWVDSAEVAQERVTAANDAIIDSYRVVAFEAVLAQTGVTDATLAMGVALGVLTEDEASLRLEVAETTAAINDLIVSEGFAALSAEKQAVAVDALALGYTDTAETAVAYAQNMSIAEISMTRSADAAGSLRDNLLELPDKIVVDVEITTTGSIPTLPTGTGGSGLAGQAQAFATGGYTGDFPIDQVVGLVHGGEFVLPANVVDTLGLPLLESLMNDTTSFTPAPIETSGSNNRQSTFTYNNFGGTPKDPVNFFRQREASNALVGG